MAVHFAILVHTFYAGRTAPALTATMWRPVVPYALRGGTPHKRQIATYACAVRALPTTSSPYLLLCCIHLDI